MVINDYIKSKTFNRVSRTALVSSQDTFSPWFEDHIMKTDKKEGVTKVSLYEYFKIDIE